MAKLVLDTSTWLDLAKPRTEEVLNELEGQVKQGITILLTCNIILEEWKRNKSRVLQEVLSSIRSHAKSALKMAELLPDEEGEKLKEIAEKYIKIQAKQEQLAEVFFDRIENLMKKSQIFSIDNETKIEMADRALTKQAPFHNSKNNMADALLYFGAVKHVKLGNEIATDLIFVTSNHKEFSHPNDFSKIHPDIDKWNVHFFNNLAKALNMRKEEIDLMDEYHEQQFWNWVESEAEIFRGK
jgi:hypothetical protein